MHKHKQSQRQKPPRLPTVFQRYENPLYYVTFDTWRRQRILACPTVKHALITHGRKVSGIGVGIGRYVIMPEHIHIFVRIAPDLQLGESIKHLKQAITKALRDEGGNIRVWQPGFFDHLMRSSESYAEKWEYVRENPVRARLVQSADDWPYQGEVVRIDRV